MISNNLSDISQEKRLKSLFENLVNHDKKFKSSINSFDISSI